MQSALQDPSNREGPRSEKALTLEWGRGRGNLHPTYQGNNPKVGPLTSPEPTCAANLRDGGVGWGGRVNDCHQNQFLPALP